MGSPRTRKRFGQHWLRSESVLQKILSAANIGFGDRILEIGPGAGALTAALVSSEATVVAVEIDRDLCRQLSDRFGSAPNFYLVEGDFLELDLPAALSQQAKSYDHPLPNKVVANIPYYITGPILEHLLGNLSAPNPCPYESIVLLVQREVAERIYARPGSRTFGALSVRLQYLAECELVCSVPAKAFQPPPKVESAVVKLTPRPLATPAQDPLFLEQLVKQGFASKRKMLRNNLKDTLDRDRLTATMTGLDISPEARAEDLGVAQWVALANQLVLEQGESGCK
ncbi:16S rRNA (adenine(1518)-N(6)/adenine(1519)-N(6))-dimethyltransferase [filamentous cyanobacterium CCP5]|nr:16S rRNA (adenine(1518)-N(6)/adenine(1519)-N(6))-dimethyltransferase [filamentous cyanobacterium CCP5]